MTTAAEPTTLHALVDLGLLEPHPLNPRPAAKPGDVRELAASILSQGLIVPLVVRPLNGSGKPTELNQAAAKYQVLAGHRRLAALRQLKADHPLERDRWDSVQVLVRSLTDAQALEVVLAENAHHVDVDPFLEGKAVDACLEAHEGDVRQVAAALGVSVRWVAVRRGLKNLSSSWRERLRNVEPFRSWPGYVAELLATLSADAQDRLFRDEAKLLDVAGGPPSRAWWELRVTERTHELGRAPFSITDAQLVKAAGACTSCPFTSTAQPGLFDDGAPEGDPKAARCLSVACWDRKVSVHFQARLQEVRAAALKAGAMPGLPLAVLPQGEPGAKAPKGCGPVLSGLEYVKVREGDKGAVPAVDVLGDMERPLWVRPTAAGALRLQPKARPAKGAKPDAPPPRTLAQQLEDLEGQHQARVEAEAVLRLLEALRALKSGPMGATQLHLAALFGATPQGPVTDRDLARLGTHDTGRRPAWPAIVQAIDTALSHSPDGFWRKAAPAVAAATGQAWPKLLATAARKVKPSRELEVARAGQAEKPKPKPKPVKVAKLDRKAHRKAKAITAAPGKGRKAKPAHRTAEQVRGHVALAEKLAKRKAARTPKPAKWTTTDARMLKNGVNRPKARPAQGTRGNPIDAAARGDGVLLPKRAPDAFLERGLKHHEAAHAHLAPPAGKALEVKLHEGGKGQDRTTTSTAPAV